MSGCFDNYGLDAEAERKADRLLDTPGEEPQFRADFGRGNTFDFKGLKTLIEKELKK